MSLNDFLNELKNTLDEVNKNLSERKSGISGIGSMRELKFMSKELTTLYKTLSKDMTIPDKRVRSLSSAWIVIDSWEHGDKLGEHICRLDHLYKEELN